jgi:hypothetical protein
MLRALKRLVIIEKNIALRIQYKFDRVQHFASAGTAYAVAGFNYKFGAMYRTLNQ